MLRRKAIVCISIFIVILALAWMLNEEIARMRKPYDMQKRSIEYPLLQIQTVNDDSAQEYGLAPFRPREYVKITNKSP